MPFFGVVVAEKLLEQAEKITCQDNLVYYCCSNHFSNLRYPTAPFQSPPPTIRPLDIHKMSISKLPQELVIPAFHPLPFYLLRTCQSLYLLLSPTLNSRITTEDLASGILLHGIQQNYPPTVHLALTHNADWHTSTTSGPCSSAILAACKLGHHALITSLISHYGPTILTGECAANRRGCHQCPFDYALRRNDLALTVLLLESGAPANRGNNQWFQKPLLTVAAKYGSVEIVEKLILHGADMEFDSSALWYALKNGKWNTARVLLREGVMISGILFQWSPVASTGKRTHDEVEAFMAAAKWYMRHC